MNVLGAIREKESVLDLEFGPVGEKYALLTRYEVKVNKEEACRGSRTVELPSRETHPASPPS